MNEEMTGLIGRHLRSWVTGRPTADGILPHATATVVVEDARHLPVLRETGVISDQTITFVPAGQTPASGDRTVGYEGSFSEAGSDISVADTIFVQSQDYSTSPYMTLVGTTLIRITADADFEAFLADADLARAEGRLAEFVLSPAVAIADVTSLGEQPHGDAPRIRLYVNDDGGMSTSPGGLIIGAVGDGLDDLVAGWQRMNAAGAHPCAVGLGAVVPESLRSLSLDERPWLGRYLEALEMHRELSGRGIGEVRISGFGGRLVPDLAEQADAADSTGASVPMLAWTPEAYYLRAPESGRMFGLSRPVAELTESLLAYGSIDAAAEHAGRTDLERVASFLEGNGISLPTSLVGAPA